MRCDPHGRGRQSVNVMTWRISCPLSRANPPWLISIKSIQVYCTGPPLASVFRPHIMASRQYGHKFKYIIVALQVYLIAFATLNVWFSNVNFKGYKSNYLIGS